MQLVIKRFGQLTAKELYQILSLRAETFIVDQQIMYNDLDNVDQVSTHVFYQDTDSVAAYLRIIDAGQSYWPRMCQQQRCWYWLKAAARYP